MKATDIDVQRLLAAQGLRATKQRKAIAAVLITAGKPLGAKQIYSRLVNTDARISFATVYRSLAALEKANVIMRQPQVTTNSALYHLPDKTVGQVVCSRCGKVEEIEVLPEMRQFSEAVSRQSGFATQEQSLYIIADCRNKQCN